MTKTEFELDPRTLEKLAQFYPKNYKREKISNHTIWLERLNDPETIAVELERLRKGELRKERSPFHTESGYGPKESGYGPKLPAVEFDTIVGTGVSGIVPLLYVAKKLGVNWLAVRKAGENTHTRAMIEGDLGRRWLFLDDFVSTGRTLAHVKRTLDLSAQIGFESKFVGVFQYYAGNPFIAPDAGFLYEVRDKYGVTFTD